MCKWIKRGVLGALVVGVVGFVLVGTEIVSYGSSSVRWIKDSVKEQVPIEFEIQRARDLLEEIVPEMHASIKQVAREEVEVALLERELDDDAISLENERSRVETLRAKLTTDAADISVGQRTYERAELVRELSRRFEQLQTAELLVAGKKKLLENRRAALHAAVKKLETTRVSRIELAAQIEALEGQFRLVQAQSSASEFSIDDSKLAQTQRHLKELRKRLAVTQKVLAREARFIDDIPVETETETSVLEDVDSYLGKGKKL